VTNEIVVFFLFEVHTTCRNAHSKEEVAYRIPAMKYGYTSVALFSFLAELVRISSSVEVIGLLQEFTFDEANCTGDATFATGQIVVKPGACRISTSLQDLSNLISLSSELQGSTLELSSSSGTECSASSQLQSISQDVECVEESPGVFKNFVADIPPTNLVQYSTWYSLTTGFNCDQLFVEGEILPSVVSFEDLATSYAMNVGDCYNFNSTGFEDIKSMRLESPGSFEVFPENFCQGTQIEGNCFKAGSVQISNVEYDTYILLGQRLVVSETPSAAFTIPAPLLTLALSLSLSLRWV